MGVGIGRAKLLLLGEHAAVHGHVAVGLCLPWTLALTHTPDERWNSDTWGQYAEPVKRLIDKLSELAAERQLPLPRPGRLEARSEIVAASGFGSSAALCAAMTNVFFPDLGPDAKDELAWRAEFLFHGTPSGIDTALAFREGWWALEPATPARPRPLPNPGLALVTGSVARNADTKTLVGSVSRRLETGDKAVRQAIDSLGALAREAVDRVERRDTTLAPLIAEAREHLRALGLETASLSKAIDAGLACSGGLAGKLSGAGGGGAFFILFADKTSAEASLDRIAGVLSDSEWRVRPTLVP